MAYIGGRRGIKEFFVLRLSFFICRKWEGVRLMNESTGCQKRKGEDALFTSLSGCPVKTITQGIWNCGGLESDDEGV